MNFNLQEKLAITVLLFILYLIPAGLEWTQFDRFEFGLIAKSMPIWLLCFYIGPFWLFYALQRHPGLGSRHVAVQAIIFVLLMWAGAHLVSRSLGAMFSGYHFPAQEQFLSALLWGIFIFTLVQMYLLYQRLVQERQLRKEAQLADLTSRLNPHFLFNSLNTISAFIHTDPKKADQVLHKLADILRYSVDQQSQWVTLDEELQVCQSYLNIEKARFNANLSITYSVDRTLDLSRHRVPPLLLQPLIENVVKHVKCRPIKLDIDVRQSNQQLTFTVQDNGAGFSQATLSSPNELGQGLSIVRKRVALVGGVLVLANQDTQGGGAVCKISLPIRLCA